MCGVVDRQSAATGSALGSSSQTEANRPGKSLPTQKPKPEKLNRKHICEAKSFGRSLLKVKVENMRTPFFVPSRTETSARG
jgi:hypothetical protein